MSPTKNFKEHMTSQNIDQNPTNFHDVFKRDEHTIDIGVKSNANCSVVELPSPHRIMNSSFRHKSLQQPLEEPTLQPSISERVMPFTPLMKSSETFHNAISSLQPLQSGFFPDRLIQLRNGLPSYALLHELACVSKDFVNPLLDVWFIDIYDVLEEFILQKLVTERHGEFIDQLEDGLIVLKIFLKHQLHRFDSLLDRLFNLLFKLYSHKSWMITCISEDLWCLLIENHDYLRQAFDLLLVKLNEVLDSSDMETLTLMNSSSTLSCIWSLLALLTSHLPIEILEFYLHKNLIFQFASTIRHPLTEVRKSFVDFIVICYSRMGDSFEMYMTEFTSAERKLIQIYMNRKRN